MRPRRAALALAALLAALAACSGGAAPPEATSTPAPAATAPPEAASTPAPTATVAPEAASTPEASPTPDARSGLDLIEPAPGAFVHRTFEDGEAIDWAHGIFVLDAETGLTEGYALAGVKAREDDFWYREHSGVWIETTDEEFGWYLLLDRESGRSWRWPVGTLGLYAVTEERLLFRDRGGRFVLANRRMEEVASFSSDPPDSSADILFAPDRRALAIVAAHEVYLVPLPSGPPALLFEAGPDASPDVLFSPDGSTLAIVAAHEVYLVPLPSGPPALLFEADPNASPDVLFSPDSSTLAIVAAHEVHLIPLPSGPPALLFEADPDVYGRGTPRIRIRDSRIGIAVESARYSHGERVGETLELHFDWDGAALPAPACFGAVSPDGRYATVQEGGPYYAGKGGPPPPLDNPWPSVVVLDADTCSPIFRVRSAHVLELFPWEIDRSAGWLSTSEGVVIGVRDGYEIVRVRPAPEISEGAVAGVPAPTGGVRYFGSGERVYDAAEHRWRGTTGVGWGSAWWGSSHRERWFDIWSYVGQIGIRQYLLLPPKIEYPPFSDEIAFRVVGTGSCLRLREEPGEEGRVLACLPDGARLLFAERDAEAKRAFEEERRGRPNPSVSGTPGKRFYASEAWVYVRTADGAEGWVSHDWLAHD